MSYALLFFRLLLAAVFAAAAAGKLTDRPGSRQALIAFGVPDRLAGPGGVLLPFLELAIAVLLLPIPTAWASATGAFLLLGSFLLAIGISLARGRRLDCHCFGQLHSAPAGWSTLARNAALAGAAGFIVWHGRADPGPSAVAWVSELTAASRIGLAGAGVGLALLTIQSALLFQVLRQQGRILLRLQGLEAGPIEHAARAQAPEPQATELSIGAPAPTFRLGGLIRETVTLEALKTLGKPVLLVFTNPYCAPCQALMPEIGRWQRDLADRLTIVLVSEGGAEENRRYSAAHGVNQILLQTKREIAEAYRIWGTPGAVLIGRDGAIASPGAQGADAIRALVAQAADLSLRPSPRAASPTNSERTNGQSRPLLAATVGDPAPALILGDLAGKPVALNNLHDKTLLLFWNPSCGFCQRMLHDLREWESDPPPVAPRLLLISTGSVEENRAMGVRSRILLDHSSEAGSAFGANGTPTAVLLDAQGRVASGVAAGAQAVFALANREPATIARSEPALNLQAS
jgi:methylamine dehydrogenase accessory protein MauD